jgi:hypothetical protein
MDKESFKKESQEKLDWLSRKIDELQKSLEAVASDVKDDAKVAAEKAVVELKELQDRLQLRFDEFQEVANSKWDDAMKVFDEASKEILDKATVKVNQAWEKLKGFFE